MTNAMGGGGLWLGVLGALFAVGCGDDENQVLDGSCEPIPAGDYCLAVADWPEEWTELEQRVVDLVNARRSLGYDCGSEGYFDPVPTLTVSPILRCVARNHSMDMQGRDYFDHVNPSCEEPWDRMERAGYRWLSAGENIAVGQRSAQEVMDDWMESDGHCANIMNPGYTDIGMGYFFESESDFEHYWTQVFGMPY